MMQEISCDDTNGESTFEFVEGKIEGLTITDDNPSTPFASTAAAPTGTSSQDPTTYAVVPNVAPPAALPSFLPNPNSAPTAMTAALSPNPITSTLPPASSSGVSFNPSNPISATPSTYPYPFPRPSAYQGSVAATQPQQLLYAGGGDVGGVSAAVATQPTAGYGITHPAVDAQSVPMFSIPSIATTAVELPFSDYDLPSQTAGYASDNRAAGSLFGWIKDTMSGSEFLTKVAEKAKNSVDSMITTLDPQMKDYIYSGGDVDIVVASDKESKVNPIREAFQLVFGRASVRGINAQATIAAQPVGFSAGIKGAEERIHYLQQTGAVQQNQTAIAVESFLVELTSDRWYDMGCIVLQDFSRSVTLHMYTQPTPVPVEAVQQIQDETPTDYPLRWSGLAVTIGQVLSPKHQVPHTEWHQVLTSIPRRDMIFMAAKTLATQYKHILGGQI